jgi:hypothetical protein
MALSALLQRKITGKSMPSEQGHLAAEQGAAPAAQGKLNAINQR